MRLITSQNGFNSRLRTHNKVSQEQDMKLYSNSIFAPIAPVAPRHEHAIVAPIAVDAETPLA